jgi:hypothetical protein
MRILHHTTIDLKVHKCLEARKTRHCALLCHFANHLGRKKTGHNLSNNKLEATSSTKRQHLITYFVCGALTRCGAPPLFSTRAPPPPPPCPGHVLVSTRVIIRGTFSSPCTSPSVWFGSYSAKTVLLSTVGGNFCWAAMAFHFDLSPSHWCTFAVTC